LGTEVANNQCYLILVGNCKGGGNAGTLPVVMILRSLSENADRLLAFRCTILPSLAETKYEKIKRNLVFSSMAGNSYPTANFVEFLPHQSKLIRY